MIHNVYMVCYYHGYHTWEDHMARDWGWPVGAVENTPAKCQQQQQKRRPQFYSCKGLILPTSPWAWKGLSNCRKELRLAYSLHKPLWDLDQSTQLSHVQTSDLKNLCDNKRVLSQVTKFVIVIQQYKTKIAMLITIL